jgi:hypothetical protein
MSSDSQAAEAAGVVFAESWWLDAAAPGRWEEVRVSSGSSSARLVYVRRRHPTGLTYVGAPPLSPRLGPLVDVPTTGKLSRQLSEQTSVMEALIAEFPPHDRFAQTCHPDFTYWTPFYRAGFEQTTLYSYVLDDLTDEDALWRGLSQSHRRKISQGGDRYDLSYDDDPGVLVDLVRATYARRNLPAEVDEGLIRRLLAASMENGAGRLTVARDRQGEPLAGAFVVWDDRRAYYLMGGRADLVEGPDAMPLVLWDAIKLAAKVTERFDFEGSMIAGIERFFRGFGSRPERYFFLSRSNRRMRAAELLRDTGLASLAGLRGTVGRARAVMGRREGS